MRQASLFRKSGETSGLARSASPRRAIAAGSGTWTPQSHAAPARSVAATASAFSSAEARAGAAGVPEARADCGGREPPRREAAGVGRVGDAGDTGEDERLEGDAADEQAPRKAPVDGHGLWLAQLEPEQGAGQPGDDARRAERVLVAGGVGGGHRTETRAGQDGARAPRAERALHEGAEHGEPEAVQHQVKGRGVQEVRRHDPPGLAEPHQDGAEEAIGLVEGGDELEAEDQHAEHGHGRAHGGPAGARGQGVEAPHPLELCGAARQRRDPALELPRQLLVCPGLGELAAPEHEAAPARAETEPAGPAGHVGHVRVGREHLATEAHRAGMAQAAAVELDRDRAAPQAERARRLGDHACRGTASDGKTRVKVR